MTIECVKSVSDERLLLTTTYVRAYVNVSAYSDLKGEELKKLPAPCMVADGTGFFFVHNQKVFLVTNLHIVTSVPPDPREEYFPTELKFRVHRKPGTGPRYRDIVVRLYDDAGNKKWLSHPSFENVDIAAVHIDDFLEENDDIERFSITRLPQENPALSFGHRITVLGYAGGLENAVDNLPTARSATLCQEYHKYLRETPYVLIEGNLPAGCSGSPVILIVSAASIFSSNLWGFAQILLIGVNSGECVTHQGALGVHKCWYAGLIVEIIEQQPSSERLYPYRRGGAI